MEMELWAGIPNPGDRDTPVRIKLSGTWITVSQGRPFSITAGERVTLLPGIYHSFWPTRNDTVIGEVSTANDDAHDNFFADSAVDRFPTIDEDEPAIVPLVSDK